MNVSRTRLGVGDGGGGGGGCVHTCAALGSQRESGSGFGGDAAGDVWVFAGMCRRSAPGTFLQGPLLTCQGGPEQPAHHPGATRGLNSTEDAGMPALVVGPGSLQPRGSVKCD